MRFLHISDLHIGKYLGEISLLDDQRYFLKEICNTAKENTCNAVVIAGDIYQRSIPSAEAILVFEDFLNTLINEMGLSVLMIAGNHDSPERVGFGSGLFDKTRLAIAGVFTTEIERVTLQDEYGDVEFFLLPYLEPAVVRSLTGDSSISTYNDAYKAVMCMEHNIPDQSKRNVVVAHGYFIDAQCEDETIFSDSERSVGGSDSVDVDIFDAFDYGAFGHMHAPQRVGRETMRYSGSILKYSLSECTQNKSVCVVDMGAKGDINISKISIPPLRDVRHIKGYFEDIVNSNHLAGENLEDYVFAELLDDYIFDGMSRLRSVFPNAIGLRFKQAGSDKVFVSKSMEEVGQMTSMELFKRFYSELMDEEIPKDREDIIREIIDNIEGGDLVV